MKHPSPPTLPTRLFRPGFGSLALLAKRSIIPAAVPVLLAMGLLGTSPKASAQVTIFTENLGTPTGTTSITNYSTGTAPATFQNKGTLTYGQGSISAPADLRATSTSITYPGASGNGNVFFTGITGSNGFSIESIAASTFNTLQLSYGYRKESASVHATFSVDYWNGSAWVTVENTSSGLFNQAASAATGWYAAKTLTLPVGAQIDGLKLRFVKSGSSSIRIDDIILTGTANPGSDTTPPAIATLSPVDNGVDVPVPSTLQIGFSETVAAGSGSISIFKSTGELVGTALTVPSSAVVISGTTVTITPSVALTNSTSYYVQISSGAFTDVSLNPYSGISDTTTWNFSTVAADTVAPVALTFTPANGATGVQPPTSLSITFNEPISQPGLAGATFVKVFKSVGGSPTEVASVDTNDIIAISANENLATISLGSTLLENGVTYTVQVDAGAFTDISGNGMASTTWSFTTVSVPDLLAGTPYTQTFSGYTSAATLPPGWTFSGASNLDATYRGDWGTVTPDPTNTAATLGGFLGGASAGARVFGYHHTSLSNTPPATPLVQTLTLRNGTLDPITDLTVAYKGRINIPANTRIPVYTVTVNGVASSVLGYSTSDGDNAQRNASINIPAGIQPGATFQINWSSAYPSGSGSARQIGISDVAVSIGSAVFAPTVAGMTVPIATIGSVSASVQANVTSDGGQSVTGRGYVYSINSVNSTPKIGGTGVTTVADGAPATGAFSANLGGLTAATTYSISAYATNSTGISYTPARTFITVGQSPSFTASYTQEFSGITGNSTNGITNMPAGWTAISNATPPLQAYVANWATTAATGGFLGGVTATPPSVPGVLGYRHTGSSGVLTVTLRLINDSGAALTSLNVSYLGRVVVNATTPEGRSPQWAVSVAGSAPVTALAYDTAGGVDATKTALVTGLSIAAGDEFSITWTSDRDTRAGAAGSSKQIGIAQIAITNPTPPSGTLFSSWALTNTGNANADPAGDHDNDGTSNGLEYFMGASGSTFTPNPGIVGGKITWPKSPSYLGTYTVQTSTNLSVWTPVSSTVVGNNVEYTPSGPGPLFIRMAVTPTATP